MRILRSIDHSHPGASGRATRALTFAVNDIRRELLVAIGKDNGFNLEGIADAPFHVERSAIHRGREGLDDDPSLRRQGFV